MDNVGLPELHIERELELVIRPAEDLAVLVHQGHTLTMHAARDKPFGPYMDDGGLKTFLEVVKAN